MAKLPAEGVSQRVEAEMVSLYDAGMDDINRMVGRALAELAEDPQRAASQYRLTRGVQLGRSIEDLLERVNARGRMALSTATKSEVDGALREAARQMAEIGLDPAKRIGPSGEIGPDVSFARVDEGAIRVVAEDTVARTTTRASAELRSASAQHGRQAVRVFHSLSDSIANTRGSGEAAFNRAIARGLISGDPRIADRAVRELFRDDRIPGGAPEAESVRRLGNKVVTVGRAEMTVRQYAMTVVRTRTREATVTARHERLGLSGISLVQITGRNSPNFCTAFIGLVCSLSGEQTIDGVTYPALASLPGGGPPFHPNCSKGTAAYVAELVSAGRARLHEAAFRTFETRSRTGRLLERVK
jgi:hypothetical protein